MEREKAVELTKKHKIKIGDDFVCDITENVTTYVGEDYEEFVFDTFSAYASRFFHTRQIIPKEIIKCALIEYKKNHPEEWENIVIENDLMHGRKHETD